MGNANHRVLRGGRRGGRRQPGTVYVAVLGVASLVLVLGLGGLASARVISRTRNETRDLSAARWAAMSAIELTRYNIESNPRWRTQRANGAWLTNVAIGNATVSVTVVNPNGDLGRSPNDPVDITATAVCGNTSHRATVRLSASVTPYTCLDVPLAAGGAITATGATVHASGYTIATNAAFTALLCTINADVEATLTAVGLTVNGAARSLVPARTLPDANAFDYYIANGTVINGSSLPVKNGDRTISNALLSATSNPYGSTNPLGIYVLDAGNTTIAIGPCRIVGTLVIINATGAVTLQSTIVAEPRTRDMPCIMIRGDATIGCTSATMTESSGTTPNYNPADTPYPWPSGVSNVTMADVYMGGIDGLVYITGNASVSGTPAINQLIIGTSLTLGGTLTLGYNADYKKSPPPGFAQVVMRPDQGSRRQGVQ